MKIETVRTSVLVLTAALRRVSELKGEIKEHGERASGAVSYVQGAEPVFRFEEEFALRAQAQEELIRLEAAVTRSNALTMISCGDRKVSIAEAIRRLQELKGDIAFWSALRVREGREQRRESEYDEASGRNVFRTTEVLHISAVGERARVAKVAELRKQFQSLNNAVEASNHRAKVTVELPAMVASVAEAVS